MCRGEKYDGWPFISFGTEDVVVLVVRTSGDLIRPAGGSSMDQFEATIRDSPTAEARSAMQLQSCYGGYRVELCCLLLLDKAIVIPHSCSWNRLSLSIHCTRVKDAPMF